MEPVYNGDLIGVPAEEACQTGWRRLLAMLQDPTFDVGQFDCALKNDDEFFKVRRERRGLAHSGIDDTTHRPNSSVSSGRLRSPRADVRRAERPLLG
jgi:hypothetical protein